MQKVICHNLLLCIFLLEVFIPQISLFDEIVRFSCVRDTNDILFMEPLASLEVVLLHGGFSEGLSYLVTVHAKLEALHVSIYVSMGK